jgi:HSP20 family protein
MLYGIAVCALGRLVQVRSAQPMKSNWVAKMTQNPLIVELMDMKKRMDALYAANFCPPAEKTPSPDELETWQPLADVWETHDAWSALVELPGVSSEDVKVEIDGDRLIVSGIRKRVIPAAGVQECREERPAGAFYRLFRLPETMSSAQVKADLKHGMLHLEVSKNSTHTRKISVRSE